MHNIFRFAFSLVLFFNGNRSYRYPQKDITRHYRAGPEVYLDCRRCDFDYIHKELNFVHYVRDPKQADIQVFVTDHSTGEGGRMFEFSFFGRRDFSGTEYTLKHIVGRDATALSRNSFWQNKGITLQPSAKRDGEHQETLGKYRNGFLGVALFSRYFKA